MLNLFMSAFWNEAPHSVDLIKIQRNDNINSCILIVYSIPGTLVVSLHYQFFPLSRKLSEAGGTSWEEEGAEVQDV